MPKSIRKNQKNKGKNRRIVFLDYAASAVPNPSSIHALGIAAKKERERARGGVAAILHARPEEIVWTSGGTEGNNLAIQGLVWGAKAERPHLVTTVIEHPSVLETCRLLEKRGLAEVSIVPVEPTGIVSPKKIRTALKPNTVLVSVMCANNEIGTVQPIRDIAREIRHYKKTTGASGLYFHTDAVQAVNYLDLNVEKLGVDMLTLSGSKIAGAGRVGVLYKKKSVPLENIFGGGDQEFGLRPGTENVQAIRAFASALEAAQNAKEKESKRLTLLRDYFIGALRDMGGSAGTGVILNGDLHQRLPNNVSVTFPKIPSDLLVIELSARGIMCSSKSACKSSRSEGSYVIEALRPGGDAEIGGLRFSLGPDTAKKDIRDTLKILKQILTKLKKWYT